jgi:uncharacterized protein (DUF2249 family)
MGNTTVELDVREDLAKKEDPFHKIMGVVGDLKQGDVFVLHAPFKPTPLLNVLKGKGFEHEIEELESKHFKVTFTKSGDR